MKAGALDADTGFGERGGKDDRVGDRQRVGGVRFCGVDVDPLEISEGFRIEPRAICEECVAAQIRYGGFQMETPGDWNWHDFVVVRGENGGELADTFGIGACGLADVESAIDAEDVATFDGGGSGDVGEFAERYQGFRERFSFGLARFCAEREDDGGFVEHDGGIFDEHRVG